MSRLVEEGEPFIVKFDFVGANCGIRRFLCKGLLCRIIEQAWDFCGQKWVPLKGNEADRRIYSDLSDCKVTIIKLTQDCEVINE